MLVRTRPFLPPPPLGAGGPGPDTKPATCCFSILLAHLVRDGVALVIKSYVPYRYAKGYIRNAQAKTTDATSERV
ncbi:hypothetical protein CKAH01_01360 [Colletotrichum kahawae]|uniref:Uncharacterized protein n=1 Tax=Colletotrichum kahawae TaxID=34407 RepID=A0AAD9Y808_COLKA|nr:hypothetical protein CKAH01_01360 [Colletotrichum kahawae]